MLDIAAHLPPVPRETCIGDPALIRSIVRANLAIFIAYLIIPAGLLRLLFRCHLQVPRRDMVLAFAGFILPCGWSHMVMAMVVYYPLYGLEMWSLRVTALISLAVGVAFWYTVPSLARIVAAYYELRATVAGQWAKFSVDAVRESA